MDSPWSRWRCKGSRATVGQFTTSGFVWVATREPQSTIAALCDGSATESDSGDDGLSLWRTTANQLFRPHTESHLLSPAATMGAAADVGLTECPVQRDGRRAPPMFGCLSPPRGWSQLSPLSPARSVPPTARKLKSKRKHR